MIGQTISHYKILEKLGEGGMGVVYKARDTKLDRDVALKFLPRELTRDPEAKERFIHEAKAASALDHNNICTIHEIGETDDGRIFIVMGCYEGDNLQTRIERGPLSVEEAVGYAIQIAEGLGEANKNLIVHRDVKPANILLAGSGVVKIVDFGLAKLSGQTKLTKTGSTLGTVAYMSPEQARGEEVDQRTDIWSLGVILYEMLTGHRPFQGAHDAAVMYAILNEEPEPLKKWAPDLPAPLVAIVHQALQKKVESRYSTAADILRDLRAFQNARLHAGPPASRSVLRRLARPRTAIPAAALLLLIAAGSVWYFQHRAKIRWAQETLIPEIERLTESFNEGFQNLADAYALALQAEEYLPDDPKLALLFRKCSAKVGIDTDPPGARVFMRGYLAAESEWRLIGTTPIESLRVPDGLFYWRMEKEGYDTVLVVFPSWRITATDWLPVHLTRVLDKKGTVPPGMVRVRGKKIPDVGVVEDFFVDRFEVTNRQFKEFVDRGGYQNELYWRNTFVKDAKVIPWQKAVAGFVDQTGRPGPATWQAGTYPEGQEEYPVVGVSWYEAAAYAAFAGKTLPTGAHWGMARGDYTPVIEQVWVFNAMVISSSNFSDKGPAAVGTWPGLTTYGAYDMAGNVREWCWNEGPEGRLIRGGAWNDPFYMFENMSQASAFDRSGRNGFRCARYIHPENIPAALFDPIKPSTSVDFYAQKPVPDAVFQVFKEQFAYDKLKLNGRVESREDNAKEWIHEVITMDAAYEKERLMVHLFLPKNSKPPFQTVLYFPGGDSRWERSSQDIQNNYEFQWNMKYLLQDGRAVVLPIYNGTFDRHVDVNPDPATRLYTEYRIKQVKDVMRCIDYLETRPELDVKKLAYCGFSWGGSTGCIIAAVEERLKVSLLYLGCIWDAGRPEVNEINFVSRIKSPVLMLNGRYDMVVPYETNAKPMFDLLGTPKADKSIKVYDTGHFIPQNEKIKESLAWLDKYLGRPLK